MLQRTGDILCSTGRGRGGQTRFISEALLREEYEAVEAVAKKTVRRRHKKIDPHKDTVSTTATTAKVSKPRTKKAGSSQQGKDEIYGDVTGTTIVKSRKKNIIKDKETSETVTVANEAAVSQTAVVATKIKKATKPKSKTSALDTLTATQAVIPEPSPVKTQLRPYQQECIDKCLENLKNGITRQIVSLPVGSGKTVSWKGEPGKEWRKLPFLFTPFF